MLNKCLLSRMRAGLGGRKRPQAVMGVAWQTEHLEAGQVYHGVVIAQQWPASMECMTLH